MISIAGFLHLCRLGVREQSVMLRSFAISQCSTAVGPDFKNSVLQQVGTIAGWFPEIASNCQFAWQVI